MGQGTKDVHSPFFPLFCHALMAKINFSLCFLERRNFLSSFVLCAYKFYRRCFRRPLWKYGKRMEQIEKLRKLEKKEFSRETSESLENGKKNTSILLFDGENCLFVYRAKLISVEFCRFSFLRTHHNLNAWENDASVGNYNHILLTVLSLTII